MAVIKVYINALAGFLWLGSLVFLAGGALAFGPPPVSAPHTRRRKIGTAVGVTVVILTLIVAGIAMWGTGLGGAMRSTRGRPLPGQLAPDFMLDLLDGSQLTLSDLRGQVTVINLWATWCIPCEEELPDLQTVWEEYRAEGVTLIGIALQDEESTVRGMAARFGITYPLGMDEGDRIFTAYGSTGVPETFVVDAQGRVADVYVGSVTAEELRESLNRLLDEK